MRVLLLCVLLAVPVHAGITVQQGELRAGADVDQDRLKYVEYLQLTLWVEGPAPLEVTTPKPVLANANTWRVYEPGLPLREVLPNGRQRWQQTFRLSPLQANKVAIVPSPLRVRAGGLAETTLDWDTAGMLQVAVLTAVDNPSVDSLRPPADIEQLPAPPGVAETRDGYLFAIVPVCLVVAFVLVRWAKKKAKPVAVTPDAAWVRAQFQEDVSPDVCAHALRAYVGYRLGRAVQARTTAELIAHLRGPDGPFTTADVARLEMLLTTCDQGRFSGQPTLATLAPHALQWLDEVEPSANLAVEVRGR